VVLAVAQLHDGQASYALIDGGACFTMRFSRYRMKSGTIALPERYTD